MYCCKCYCLFDSTMVETFGRDWGSHFENEICYSSSTYKDGGIDNLPDSGNTINEEGKESSTLQVEDSEVRMDLTDDLLHMVSY